MSDLLSSRAVADLLGIPRTDVRTLTRYHVLPCIRITPRMWRYDRGQVLAKARELGISAPSPKEVP